jgi:hypothetical protein
VVAAAVNYGAHILPRAAVAVARASAGALYPSSTGPVALCVLRAWSSSSCSSSSPSPSSSVVAGSPLQFVQLHLVASVAVSFYPFVYSDNSRLHRQLLPPLLYVCECPGGLLCWSRRRQHLVMHPPSHVRYWQHRCVPSYPRHFRAWQTWERLAHRLLTASTSASTPFSTASTRRRLRPWWLPLRSTVLTMPPRAFEASCAAPYLRQPRQLHVATATLRTTSSTIDISTKGYHPHVLQADFLSSRSICTATTFQLRGAVGGGVVSPSAFAFGLFSNLTVCGTPAMTAGEC